jgi:hypothetical protein
MSPGPGRSRKPGEKGDLNNQKKKLVHKKEGSYMG